MSAIIVTQGSDTPMKWPHMCIRFPQPRTEVRKHDETKTAPGKSSAYRRSQKNARVTTYDNQDNVSYQRTVLVIEHYLINVYIYTSQHQQTALISHLLPLHIPHRSKASVRNTMEKDVKPVPITHVGDHTRYAHWRRK